MIRRKRAIASGNGLGVQYGMGLRLAMPTDIWTDRYGAHGLPEPRMSSVAFWACIIGSLAVGFFAGIGWPGVAFLEALK